MKLDEITCEQLAQDSSWPLQGMAPRLIRLRRSVTELEQRLSSLERSVEGEDLRQLVLAASTDQLDQENGVDEEWPERARSEERSQTAPTTPRRKPPRTGWRQDMAADEDDHFSAVNLTSGDLEAELNGNYQIFNHISPKTKYSDKKSTGKANCRNRSSNEKGFQKISSKYDSLEENLAIKNHGNMKTLGDISGCEAALENILNEQELIEHEITEMYSRNNALSKAKLVGEKSSEKKKGISKTRGSKNSSPKDTEQANVSRKELGGENKSCRTNSTVSSSASVAQRADRDKTKSSRKNAKLNKQDAVQITNSQNKNRSAPIEGVSTERRTGDKCGKFAISEGTALSSRANKVTNILTVTSNKKKKDDDATRENTHTNQSTNGTGKSTIPKSGKKTKDRCQQSSLKLTKKEPGQRINIVVGTNEPMMAAATASKSGKVQSLKVASKPVQPTGRGEEGSSRKKKRKPKILLFHINCEQPAGDRIFDVNDFEVFLKNKFKVDGRVNNLDRAVIITSTATKVTVTTRDLHFSKRYLKYLSKKYLQKKGLRDWLRVVSSSTSAGDTYDLRYFKFTGLEGSEDEES